jgi:hypothetical protein
MGADNSKPSVKLSKMEDQKVVARAKTHSATQPAQATPETLKQMGDTAASAVDAGDKPGQK